MKVTVLVDGSNTLFWGGEQARPELPKAVATSLVARRFQPVVFFDHSIDRWMNSAALDGLRMIAEVIIAPRGTKADALLLAACQGGKIQIISNDRFRDWRPDYPHMRKEWFVTGSIGKGQRVSFSKKLRSAPL
ncbi:hypothetical protein [Sulfitobacter donghicola]|uniref:RNase NYN domain-containing protein n=1 Tax=Sulfitobacter donghicola DSW-25 = KCTC 12864 = JCM 14565 TaxID=1300350 RepID=A0A073IFN4_9RHOB|nr:hypothetical protein [Sulfitobacter donghicola]KEJ89168.1 hypothetical protein DSW25_12995 [Sulfitobacter donghicola DSW-25 = KCTC 12864 = JCM 14565]KIN67289.1 RNase Zc3h12a domain containing protein [Sulfitobacter donghicola DSW-25 = KCTC 12864 = JCM 14565]